MSSRKLFTKWVRDRKSTIFLAWKFSQERTTLVTVSCLSKSGFQINMTFSQTLGCFPTIINNSKNITIIGNQEKLKRLLWNLKPTAKEEVSTWLGTSKVAHTIFRTQRREVRCSEVFAQAFSHWRSQIRYENICIGSRYWSSAIVCLWGGFGQVFDWTLCPSQKW